MTRMTIAARGPMGLHSPASVGALLSGLFGLPGRLAATLFAWRKRAIFRDTLRAMDAHMLADVGLTRAEAEAEIRKPFWVA